MEPKSTEAHIVIAYYRFRTATQNGNIGKTCPADFRFLLGIFERNLFQYNNFVKMIYTNLQFNYDKRKVGIIYLHK